MSNFCMLAYIPGLVLVIWLLIELRKFVNINKRLNRTKLAWNRVQAHRSKTDSNTDEIYVETIPTRQSTGRSRSSQTRYSGATEDTYDDWSDNKSGDRRRRSSPAYGEYGDYADSEGSDYDHEYERLYGTGADRKANGGRRERRERSSRRSATDPSPRSRSRSQSRSRPLPPPPPPDDYEYDVKPDLSPSKRKTKTKGAVKRSRRSRDHETSFDFEEEYVHDKQDDEVDWD